MHMRMAAMFPSLGQMGHRAGDALGVVLQQVLQGHRGLVARSPRPAGRISALAFLKRHGLVLLSGQRRTAYAVRIAPAHEKPGAVSRPGVMHRLSCVLLDDGLLYEIRVTPVYRNRQSTDNFCRSGAAPAPARTARDVNARRRSVLRFAFSLWQPGPQRASTYCLTATCGTASASACGGPRPACSLIHPGPELRGRLPELIRLRHFM